MDGEQSGPTASTGDRPRTLAEDYRRLGATQDVKVIVLFDDGSRIVKDARLRYSKNYPHAKKGRGPDPDAPFGEVSIWWTEK